MEFKKVSGIVAATITPFTQAGKIDFGTLDNLTDFLVDKGVQGLFPCGSTGEGVLMNIEERKAVAQSTLKRVAGRIPVIIHTVPFARKRRLS
ncbi:MAG: dihydrodipicolinate synthase family protein [Anaerolineaceae bacterium]|nr:dihydrodipicolinate synthase family protein [Anaerolineaceae bacterium]